MFPAALVRPLVLVRQPAWMRRSVCLLSLLIVSAAPLLLAGCHRSSELKTTSDSAGPPIAGDGAQAVAASPRPAHFVDVTARAGIQFHYERCATGQRYLPETMGPGCAFLDYDRDGWEDILLLQGKPLPGSHCKEPMYPKLYHNNHNGTFTDETGKAGLKVSMYAMGVAVGDYDNDGYDDIYITAVLGPSHLFHNNGNGTFTDVTDHASVANKGMWGTSACWVDYDRDGYLDLFVCNYVRYRTLADDVPCYYRPGVRSYCIPRAYAGSTCELYHNNRNGTFTDVTRAAGIESGTAKALAVAVCDLNNDGWPDIIVANDTVRNFAYQNNKDGTFKDIGVVSGLAYGPNGGTKAGMGLAVADDQNKGALAVAVGNFFGESMAFYRQGPSGLFTDVGDEAGIAGPSVDRLSFGTVFFDYDNDGYPDLMFACGHVQEDAGQFQSSAEYKEPQLLYHNQHNGAYADVSAASGPPVTEKLVGRGLAAGDFDNDGRVDILIGSNDGKLELWQNRTTPCGQWITLSLEGTHCNRDAIGAKVSVKAGGMVQTQWVRSGGSYLSESDRRLHFGLGDSHDAAVSIAWPDGRIQQLSRVSSGQILHINEP